MFCRLIAAIGIIFLLTSPSSHALTGTRELLLNGSSLWTPLNIGTLVAWWDAQYIPNLTFNGSTISAWKDRKSGTVASQATGTAQPGWSATARNGKPGLTFNGTTQFLTFTPTGFPSGSSIGSVAVAAYSATTNPGNQQISFTYGLNASTAGESVIAEQNTNGAAALSTSGGTPVGTISSWNLVDRFQVITISGTTGAQNVDGAATESGSVTSANVQLNTGSIGEWQYFGNKWNGPIQQVVVASSVLTTCQRQKLEGWESWYDGKSGTNLPSNHPYKAGAPLVGGAC